MPTLEAEIAAAQAHEKEEGHRTTGERVRDIVIGMSDGLTVPFALAAGISGAVTSTHLVVTTGMAEVAAGSIAMGLGGYLAARGDAEHYASEEERERREIVEKTAAERGEIVALLGEYGVGPEDAAPVVAALARSPESWVRFMMRFELGLTRPHPRRALTSALTIGGAYVAGGLFPLAPYFLLHQIGPALAWSVVMTLLALALFGYGKGRFLGQRPVMSAIQTVVIGGVAATAAFLLARLFSA